MHIGDQLNYKHFLIWKSPLTRIWSIWLKSREVVIKHKSAVIVWINLQRNEKTHRCQRKGFHRHHFGSMEQVCLLFLPDRLPACSLGREGSWGHIGECAPQGVFLPDQPRVSSYGGPTPGPRCPAEGYNAGAGALKGQKKQSFVTRIHKVLSSISAVNYRELSWHTQQQPKICNTFLIIVVPVEKMKNSNSRYDT